ncbi:MAG TPA: hypothetical protein DCO70_02570 [Verrucomicrobiales bacterium]|nr:hypothetical protein [Verrucomicrobiales bacterium]HAH98190.1 hypothetical protein [Verrucomicrobiales bacterium]|tara:strand:- start:3146 stop:3328 length:183 start_codon:yes stop_codon:yes gene_type:complete
MQPVETAAMLEVMQSRIRRKVMAQIPNKPRETVKPFALIVDNLFPKRGGQNEHLLDESVK